MNSSSLQDDGLSHPLRLLQSFPWCQDMDRSGQIDLPAFVCSLRMAHVVVKHIC